MLDVRKLTPKGNFLIPLHDRGKEESDRDLIAAKGQLGAIHVAWRFTEIAESPETFPLKLTLHVARVCGVSYLGPNALVQLEVRSVPHLSSPYPVVSAWRA